jgi:predicted O-methyltransferase YrrM
MDDAATLTSVDTDPRVQAVAREFLGHDPRLTLITEDGATFLRRRLALTPPLQFDLIFADAIPEKYECVDEALALVAPGGFYVIDDMLPVPHAPLGLVQRRRRPGEKAASLQSRKFVPTLVSGR